jgi:hypothetical protein
MLVQNNIEICRMGAIVDKFYDGTSEAGKVVIARDILIKCL